MEYATVDDIINRYKSLTTDEIKKVETLIPEISSALRLEAKNVNKDLDQMAEDSDYFNVVRMVVCDIVIRRLEQDADHSSTLSQETQSALGYSWSGTYVNTGGGTSILNKDLKRLGLRRQKMYFTNFLGVDDE